MFQLYFTLSEYGTKRSNVVITEKMVEYVIQDRTINVLLM